MSLKVSRSRRERSKKRSRHVRQTRVPGERIPVTGILTGALLWAVVVLLLYRGGEWRHTSMAPGQKAPTTVIASVDFECLDLAKTELNRRRASDNVQPVFSVNPAPLSMALRTLEGLFKEAEASRQSDLVTEEIIERIPDIPEGATADPLSFHIVLQAAPPGGEVAVSEALKQVLSDLWNQGVISEEDRRTRFQDVAVYGRIALHTEDAERTTVVNIENLRLPGEAMTEVVRQVVSILPDVSVRSSAVRTLIEPVMAPNLVYEPQLTETARQHAARDAEPEEITIRAGTTLVEAGERLNDQRVEELRAHEKKRSALVSESDRLLRMAGHAGLLLVMLAACGGLMRLLSPKAFRRRSYTVLLAVACLLSLLGAKGLLALNASTTLLSPSLVEFLVPLALAPMLAAILVDRPSAVVVGIWTSFAAAVMFDNSFIILSIGLVVTAVAVHAMRDVSKRSRVMRVGLWVGLAKMIFVISMALWHRYTLSILLTQAATALASGFVAALLVLLLLPLFEALFGITTDIRLLELSDMEHPLLRRMAMEAPGTYHHSLMVANLAQAAASDIGASALLARVCAYYHDIGKLTKPEFFTENMGFHVNPHDNLAPSMSTLVIIAHVKEGVSLATQYKLPRPVIQAIQQHHGTSVVHYFYHRARKRADQDGNGGSRHDMPPVNDQDFRYPGPKPSRPEMGILLLADSVEAASRSMEKPTAAKIEALIKDIVDHRLQDGQLDQCSLTFAQLTAIKQSMVFTLTNMLHVRTPYPQDENRTQQPPENIPDKPGPDPAADPVVDRAGAAV